ncbi:MAG: metallophosphoesterase family protein, partial [Candidatus Saccharimonadales bacterium]
MPHIRQFHSPKLSIWQSAVDEALAKKLRAGKTVAAPSAPPATPRPDATHPAVSESASYCAAASGQVPPTGLQAPTPPSAAPSVAGAIAQTLGYCSATALKLAKAIITCDEQAADRYRDELGKFTDCDPLYAQAAAKYAEYFIAQGKKIPYRVYQRLDDYVIDGKLPDKGRVAIVGDWGTGLGAALNVLRQIAAKKPDIVIHLGDVYYSGTAYEVENYFHAPWEQILGLQSKSIPTFTLSGNHDMYSGGVAYYQLIDQLGQPSSYFCLRNSNWQFLAMDTGLHDSDPAAGGAAATYLEDTELVWHKDKMDKAGGRRTVVLS